MAGSLSDIEALVLQCHTESSRLYIAEAISCYKAGAYRSAIVSTWIAVVFDLIDKIRELAISGDGKAKVLYDKYEKYIAQIENGSQTGVTKALEFEREIVDLCRDELAFFDQQHQLEILE